MTALKITGVFCLVIVGAAADVLGQGESMAGDHALIVAAERNDVATIRRLLEAGTDVRARDAKGRTALLAATTHNHIESAKLLIEAGADVNAQDGSSTARYF